MVGAALRGRPLFIENSFETKAGHGRPPLQSCLTIPHPLNYPARSEIENRFQFIPERFGMVSLFCRCWLLISFSAILVSASFAQTPKSVLRGRVVDPNHAAIPGADISASGNGLTSSSVVTDRNGEFSFALD